MSKGQTVNEQEIERSRQNIKKLERTVAALREELRQDRAQVTEREARFKETIAALREELRTQMTEREAHFQETIAALRKELRTQMTEREARFKETISALREDLRQANQRNESEATGNSLVRFVVLLHYLGYKT